MKKNCVVIKPGKEKALLNRHHWIFSGAVLSSPKELNGELLPVLSADGQPLGSAYFNGKSQIIGRMVAFDSTPPLDAIANHLDAAIGLRTTLFKDSNSNAYRLV